MNKANGQNHQGRELTGTTLSAAKAGTASASNATKSKPVRFNDGVVVLRLDGCMRLRNILVIQVLRVVGLCKKEPPLGQ
jgi:hypothetical protein